MNKSYFVWGELVEACWSWGEMTGYLRDWSLDSGGCTVPSCMTDYTCYVYTIYTSSAVTKYPKLNSDDQFCYRTAKIFSEW